MKRTLFLGVVFATAMVLLLPFVGGGGPSILSPAYAAGATVDRPVVASGIVVDTTSPVLAAAVGTIDPAVSAEAKLDVDTEHVARKPVPRPPAFSAAAAASGALQRWTYYTSRGLSCPSNVSGTVPGAPGRTSPEGVGGTTTADLQSFAVAYNQIRVANCLKPIAMSRFRYDKCMEDRLFWMAEDPSTNPASAWGHIGSKRSDGVPSRGCDGNLAGGAGNTGATVAQKWWDSAAHRASLYRPSSSTSGVCIYFAMSHGGVPNEPYSFTRAAARWGGC